jgi:hypothetical protein
MFNPNPPQTRRAWDADERRGRAVRERAEAARVMSISPLEISGLLDERFRLVTGGRRSAVTGDLRRVGHPNRCHIPPRAYGSRCLSFKWFAVLILRSPHCLARIVCHMPDDLLVASPSEVCY